MGILRSIFTGTPSAVVSMAGEESGPRFAVDGESVPPEVFGLTAYVAPTAPEPRITRREAMSVPAVKRVRDIICSSLGSLPIDIVGPEGTGSSDYTRLFEQPEKDVPRSVTLTRTFEDLLFEGRAWWLVTEFGWHGYPVRIKRLDPRSVSVDEHRGVVMVDGRNVPDRNIIRFEGPTDGLLIEGARAIRTCLRLDAAASRYADEPLPLAYFRPTDATTHMEPEDAQEFLNSWAESRRARATGYVPQALTLETAGWNPEQIQLADARQHAVLEIARLGGVEAKDLGVPITSETYQNQQDARKNLLDFSLGQYRQAFEDRLSMGDVTPRAYSARFRLSEFLRSDDKTRMEVAAAGLASGLLTQDEARAYFDPDLPVSINPAAAPRAVDSTVSPSVSSADSQVAPATKEISA